MPLDYAWHFMDAIKDLDVWNSILEAWTISKFNTEIKGDTKYTKSFDSDPLVHSGFWNGRETNVLKKAQQSRDDFLNEVILITYKVCLPLKPCQNETLSLMQGFKILG